MYFALRRFCLCWVLAVWPKTPVGASASFFPNWENGSPKIDGMITHTYICTYVFERIQQIDRMATKHTHIHRAYVNCVFEEIQQYHTYMHKDYDDGVGHHMYRSEGKCCGGAGGNSFSFRCLATWVGDNMVRSVRHRSVQSILLYIYYVYAYVVYAR